MTATLEKPPLEFRQQQPWCDLQELVPDGKILLDVGAGKGYWARNALKLWPNAFVHSFEPNGALTELLNVGDGRRFCANWCGLAHENGMGTLNVTKNVESSSFLPFLEGNPLESATTITSHKQVPIKRLDDWLKEMGVKPAQVGLLKMDVQGTELNVLEGASSLLAAGVPIFCEVSFQPQYQNHPLLEDVDAWMSDHGYRRLHLYPSPHPEIWGDAIYVADHAKQLPCLPEAVGRTDAEERTGSHPAAIAPIRLNIGAGATVIEGFTPIDRKLGTEAFPLDYADNSVEEVRCVHMLEHLSYGDVEQALREWHRVLKPGGRLRISVPDVDKVFAMSKTNALWRFYLMGGQMDADDFHRSAFDHDLLCAYLTRSGFERVQTWTCGNTDLASADFSLNLEGFKSDGAPIEQMKDVKIRAIIGMPRIGWNDSWQTIVDALHPFNIPIETHQGCFWGQNVQKAMERAVKSEIDWLICFDYDSMIQPIHISRLMEILGQNPQIDAIAPLQMRRGQEAALVSKKGCLQAEMGAEPIQVDTAHFGCTILRVECLRKLSKPYMIDVPDANGEFNGDHVDADIHFWKKWAEAGNTVYLAPDVKIGHLELLVSEYDDEFKPRHFHVGDWWNRHARAGHCLRSKKEA